ncbi:MAG: hypothetical protein R2754_13375 [Microthrixaceae bacterium]
MFKHIGKAYVVLCALLAAQAIFWADPSYLPYNALLVVTFPLGLIADYITYVGGTILFGPNPGVVGSMLTFILWVAIATVQMFAVRTLIRDLRRKRADREQ